MIKDTLFGFSIIGMLIAGLFVAASFKPSKGRLQRTLEAAGYQDVHFTGCGNDDMFHDGFTAKDANNQLISGVVCSAPLKGLTIRLD
jgi:hypothetical protein